MENKKILLKITCFWTIVVTLGMINLSLFAEKTILKQQIAKLEAKMASSIEGNETSELFDDENIVEYIKISDFGKKQIKEFEQLSLTAYNDGGNGRRSIGYGHQIKSDDPRWLRKLYYGGSLTKKQAERLFEKDIETMVEPAVNRINRELVSLGVDTDKFSQGFYDALGSMIYNCGESGVKKTEFYRLLKKGKIGKAIALVPTTHIYAEGHKTRRRIEAEMMEVNG